MFGWVYRLQKCDVKQRKRAKSKNWREEKRSGKVKDVTNNLVKLNECRFCCCLFLGIFRISFLKWITFLALSKIFKFYYAINLDFCSSCSYVVDIFWSWAKYMGNTLRIMKLKWNVGLYFVSSVQPIRNLWFPLKMERGNESISLVCGTRVCVLIKCFQKSARNQFQSYWLSRYFICELVNGKYHEMMTTTQIKWTQNKLAKNVIVWIHFWNKFFSLVTPPSCNISLC